MANDQTAKERRQEARQSFTGSRLTHRQFAESWQIADILHRAILHSGSFVDKLADYAHAFARTEKFDAARGEIILRDMFTARYGQSLNELRKDVLAHEAMVKDHLTESALDYAQAIPERIRAGKTLPFYQAYDQAAVAMARKHDITEVGAKTLMKNAFRQAGGRDLYTVGKAAEEEHHAPVRRAEMAARTQERHTERQIEYRPRARSGPRR